MRTTTYHFLSIDLFRVSSSCEGKKTKLQVSKLKSLMASLYVGGLVFAPFTTTAKKSSVHIVTTSYAAEVVSPLPKPQPQLKNTPKYHVRLGL